jgi:hypothetical protein
MTPTEVIEEMRDMAAQPQLPRDLWIYGRLNSWADALERAMREKDAEIERLRNLLTECDGKLGKKPCQTGRCMEYVRLREALQQIANRAIPIQREEHRIARAALAGKEGKT